MDPGHRSWTYVLTLILLCACSPAEESLQAVHRDGSVMSTALDVTVYRRDLELVDAGSDLDAAFAAITEIDQLMSLYKNESELVALNEQAGSGSVPVSALTFEVLQAAIHYATVSDDALDITVKPLVDLWGFYEVEDAAVPTQDRIDDVRGTTGMNRVALDAADQSVTLDPGTQLDLGSIAKGYAVDRALAVLRERDVPAALINLGGTIGVLGTHPSGRPWAIGVRHPRDNLLMGEIRLEAGAVSTSGDYDRYFEHEGNRYSHILDPRTGWAVEGVYAVTVVAANAAAADALSTAAFVLGPNDGMALLTTCAGVEGLLVEPSGDDRQLNVWMTDIDDETMSFAIDSDPMIATELRSEDRNAIPDFECVMSDGTP